MTYDGSDDGVGVDLGPNSMSDVEGDGDEETDDDRDGDDEVGSSRRVEILGESSPGDGLRVVRLNLLTGPNVGLRNRFKSVSTQGDDERAIRTP